MEHASQSPGPSPRALLTQVLESREQSLNDKVYEPNFDAFVVGNLVLDFDRAVQQALQIFAWPEAGLSLGEPARSRLKPACRS